MTVRLIVHRLFDWLLSLLPGKASDPTSLEARVRSAGKTADLVHAKAMDAIAAAAAFEEKVEREVSDAAKEAVAAAERAAADIKDRITKLKELI